MNQERLQKVLARAGIASRRHAEQLIVAGHVRVNGRVVTELGMRVDAHEDKVEVDGRRIVLESPVYAILHKPRGVVTTLSDPEGRPTIAEAVKSLGARVFPIGRLDFHTSGALLVTNDGALAQALLHPRQHVPKVYVAKIRGVPTDGQLDAWRNGVVLPPTESDPDERPTKTLPADVRVLRQGPPGEDSTTGAGATWIQVTLREGRTRQIHRMADATGLFVMRLVRISFAEITTEGLRPGELRELTEKELTALRVRFLRPVEQGAFGATPTPDDFEEEIPKRPARRESPRASREPSPRREVSREAATAPKREGSVGRYGSAPKRDEGPRRDEAPKREAYTPKREARAPKREERGASGPSRERAPRREERGASGPQREERGASRPSRESAPRREERGARAPSRESAPKREERGARGPSRESAPRREERGARGPSRESAPKREEGGARGPSREERGARGPSRESAPKREERGARAEAPRGKPRRKP